jgi:hypothetical protein
MGKSSITYTRVCYDCGISFERKRNKKSKDGNYRCTKCIGALYFRSEKGKKLLIDWYNTNKSKVLLKVKTWRINNREHSNKVKKYIPKKGRSKRTTKN